MKIDNKTFKADALLVLVAIVWGGGFIVIKDSLNTMTPLILMSLRFVLAGITVAMIFYKQLKNITKCDIRNGAIVGFFLYGGYAFQNVGLKYTTASNSAFLTAVNVVLVPFIIWFYYKKPPQIKVFVASFITLVGVGLMSLDITLIMGKGDILSLICAIFFAGHVVSIGVFVKESDPRILTLIQIITAGILMSITALLLEPIPTYIEPRVWYGLIYQVFFATILCYGIQNFAQKNTTASHASIILSLEAFFTMILAVIFLNERLNFQMVLGGVMIFLAIIIVELNIGKRG